MFGKIYKITNNINGKIYVGQTTKTLKERFQKHCWGTTSKDKYHLNMAIKMAIRKYGKENFTIELLEETEIDNLDKREIYWISYFDSYNKGYNCTLGGQNGATNPTKLSNDEELEVIKLKLYGLSCKELSKLYGINRTSVKNIFKRHGVEMPNKRNLSDRINKSKFTEFLKTNPTIKQIMDRFKICKCSVYNFIKNNNIEYNFPTSVQTLTDKAEG